MKRLLSGIVFLILSFSGWAQTKADLGIFGGVSYYMGDINPKKQFYSPGFTLGGIYRYNFDPHFSLRASMLFSDLSADDLDFNNNFQQQRRANFDTEVVDLALQVEFNFQPFWVPKKSRTKGLVPYVTGGIGYIAPTSTGSSLTIPMGAGLKFNLPGRWSGAFEWSFRKSFTDDLDNLDDPFDLNQKSIAHNNDWVSFVGVIITYKLFPDNEECHSYDRFVR
ncbi:MAG: DUF6089 family protein [Marinifilaceae bacterium]